MRIKIAIMLISVFMAGGFCFGQSLSTVIEDFKPSSVNQPGKVYP